MSTAAIATRAVTTLGRQTSGRWMIDPQHTAVAVRAHSFGLPVRGSFDHVTGMIDIPDDITQSRVEVTVHADSFTTGGRLRDRFVSGPGFLDSGAHPRLTFKAAGLRPIIEPLVTADGDRPLWWLPGELTVLGRTRPLRLALGVVRHGCDGDTLEFNATATVRRSDLGISRARRLISDVVEIRIEGRARRGEPTD